MRTEEQPDVKKPTASRATERKDIRANEDVVFVVINQIRLVESKESSFLPFQKKKNVSS